jgi:4-diphosphocytidyl-2-C-methyl-D-erythritol kinase
VSVPIVAAPAKLTLSLAINGIREDGYHLIDAEMVSLDLADELEITESDRTMVEVVDEPAGGLPIALGDDNLISRALRLIGRDATVRVVKRIPAGAGLGGGSSDAAAVLRWGGFTDIAAAARIGADVAFCLAGGRARVRGIGEIVEPLPFVARAFTLVVPPFGCSTPEVYRRWDELGGPKGDNGNDLEAAAVSIEPRLTSYRDALARHSGLRPRLAGSGSTWFVEGAFAGPGFVVVSTVPG